ncbi:nuclear transport factor 2 family protein [Kineosporia sp. J2-2]|uniref:Nuclear transport factor 2 family protein n=1 Tax=Kineosporia corallincola TaxID=2835133 RepID=A0ABS5TLF7_9ACTN|nr:nuclear transport factor 2 family protein [Kineosporia corallincola]MBT0770878.1 nuclear transport factor 2 family protein [Kineosporia corallincola]
MTANSTARDDLAQAYAAGPAETGQVFARLLADRVEVRHEPPEPADGFHPGPLVARALAQRQALFAGLMPDYAETARLTQQNDLITVELTIGGTLADGTHIEVPGVDVLTVAGGRITRMVSRFDAESMRPLLAALGL